MFCGHCGTKMQEIDLFCPGCGNQRVQATPETSQEDYIPPTPELNQEEYAPPTPEASQEAYTPPVPEVSQEAYTPPIREVSQEAYTLPVPEVNQEDEPPPAPQMSQEAYIPATTGLNQENIHDVATGEPVVPEGAPVAPTGEPSFQEPKPKNSNAQSLGIIGGICAIIVLLIGLGLFLLFRTTTVEVPDLSNLELQSAIEQIEELGLAVGEITEEYSDDVDEGRIISQYPPAGEEVERETAIDLTISLGVEPVEVPDLTGLSLYDAAAMIRDLNLTLGSVDEEFSERVGLGFVISQSVRAGTRVPPGETIDLVISLGPEYIVVPTFMNLTEDEAVELIESMGLIVGTITEEYNNDVEEGLVFGQSLEVGEVVDPGESIDLVISAGPRPPSISPFDLDVWGPDHVVTLELDGVTVDVPIPPWLDVEENLSLTDGGYQLFIYDWENDTLHTMVEVFLVPIGDINYFDEEADEELDFIVYFLNSLDFNSDAYSTIFVREPGSLTAGINILEYQYEDSDEFYHIFELVKISEYNGIMISTRLRLRTVDAPAEVCSDEFAYAFGLWRYIEMGFITMDP